MKTLKITGYGDDSNKGVTIPFHPALAWKMRNRKCNTLKIGQLAMLPNKEVVPVLKSLNKRQLAKIHTMLGNMLGTRCEQIRLYVEKLIAA